ncbi:MAG: amino acid-binding protein [Lachnospiraceae bacterium]|nr:amino acid-binding protein [Lachnospiraceae bacterium]
MIRQVVAFVENQKGIIRQMTTGLREAGISICGLSTVDSPEFGIVRMIVDQPEAALKKLTGIGFVARACEVIAVRMESPEGMEEVLRVIEDGNVNVNYFYSSFGKDGREPILILNAADMDETEAMLRGHGFFCMEDLAL